MITKAKSLNQSSQPNIIASKRQIVAIDVLFPSFVVYPVEKVSNKNSFGNASFCIKETENLWR